MSFINITTEKKETYSSISNFFIDYYMTSANGEFVKVYLYLVRLMSSRKPISVADIADHFNLTEQDICRAIRYWIKQHALRLEYNSEKELTGITLLQLESREAAQTGEEADGLELLSRDYAGTADDAASDSRGYADKDETPAATASAGQSAPTRSAPEKVHMSRELLKKKKDDEVLSDLIFETEAYFGKGKKGRLLSLPEVECLVYMYDQLGFSQALIEYLIEYCVTKGKTSLKYAEAIAVSWYEKGIDTVAKAKLDSASYDPFYKKVLSELRINRSSATSIETAYIEAWRGELGFSEELILLACRKAIFNKPQSVNFAYVNGIIEDWHRKGLKTPADVEKNDAEFARRKSETAVRQVAASNPKGFGGFEQKSKAEELGELERLLADQLNSTAD